MESAVLELRPVRRPGDLFPGNLEFPAEELDEVGGSGALGLRWHGADPVGDDTDSDGIDGSAPPAVGQTGILDMPSFGWLYLALFCPQAVADDKMGVEVLTGLQPVEDGQFPEVSACGITVKDLDAIPGLDTVGGCIRDGTFNRVELEIVCKAPGAAQRSAVVQRHQYYCADGHRHDQNDQNT